MKNIVTLFRNFLYFLFCNISDIIDETIEQIERYRMARRGWMIQLEKSRSAALKSIQNVYARLLTGSSGISIVHASKRLKDDLSLFYSVAGVYRSIADRERRIDSIDSRQDNLSIQETPRLAF